MSSLIQVPGSTDQIRDFLADGNVQSAPAVTGADINDGDLLNATRTIDVGNGYKFEITLPSGRVLESAPVGSDYPKRDAIMQWLGAVRESIVEDSANAARASRDSHMAEARARDLSNLADGGQAQSLQSRSGTQGLSVPSTQSGTPQPSDPIEYARSQLRGAIERLAALTSAEADVAKWQRVVESLTGVPKKRRKKRKTKKVIV